MGEFIENKNMCSSQSVTFNLWIIIDGLGVFFFLLIVHFQCPMLLLVPLDDNRNLSYSSQFKPF